MRAAVLFAGLASIATLAACQRPPAAITPTTTGAGGAGTDAGGDLPVFPLGADAIRGWDRWPLLRIGARTYMRSTYDRSGGNEGADASHFIRQEANGLFTTLDVAGNGVLSFVRTNHWHGSPWHYVVDGTDTAVTESSTTDPNAPVTGSTFRPAAAFPPPLALTWSTAEGADLSWVPIGFSRTLRLGYERTHYGTGYYIYELVAPGAPVQSIPATWHAIDEPPADVLALVNQAGADIAPTGAGVTTATGGVDVPATAGTVVPVWSAAAGPAAVRALHFDVPAAAAEAFGRASIRITWDDRALPSIDAPVALFFGAGTLYNRDGREFLVRAFPVSVRFTNGTASLASYFPMPFQRAARIELVSSGEEVAGVAWQVRTAAWGLPANQAGYFHATFHDHGTPFAGQDLVLLDTTTDEGGGAWCGNFVGTAFTFSNQANLGTLEGDPRFFFDDSQTPQAQGTGTEEWGGGGDYWEGGVTTTLPFAGHPTGAPSPSQMLAPEDGIESAYRYLLSDLFPFGRRARIQLEHGGEDDSTEHYTSVALWYGLPGACLVETDSFQVGDPTDEAAHDYLAPAVSTVETLTSRYEWGVDTLDGQVIYPATTDVGRVNGGTSELTLQIDPANFGVLLRRKLDYDGADQRAEVWVADDAVTTFADAGTWYLAGSNRCLYSNPAGELDAAEPVVETSDRRFRDDEFLIPRALTEGRSRIRVRIVPALTALPLGPGIAPAPADGSWSEMRYDAYVWKLPPAP
jgi:Protein of unknown function (DUF2961)